MTGTCKPYSSLALSAGARAGHMFMCLHPWHRVEEAMKSKECGDITSSDKQTSRLMVIGGLVPAELGDTLLEQIIFTYIHISVKGSKTAWRIIISAAHNVSQRPTAPSLLLTWGTDTLLLCLMILGNTF